MKLTLSLGDSSLSILVFHVKGHIYCFFTSPYKLSVLDSFSPGDHTLAGAPLG